VTAIRSSYPAPRIDPDDREWQRGSACSGQALYFDEEAANPFERRFRERRAKALCGRCPVRGRCAAYALARGEPYGIWGGFNEYQRRRLLTLGWTDAFNRTDLTVDVARLEARLHLTAPVDRDDHDQVPGKSVAS
jgi:WhiB family redox-sensing transcriptional regulator